MSTFGNTVVGTLLKQFSSVRIVALGPFTAPESGTITAVSAYLGIAATATDVTLGVYMDSAGFPSTLLVVGAGQAPVVSDWLTATITAPVVAGNVYWVGTRQDGFQPYMYDVGTGTSFYSVTFTTYAPGTMDIVYPSALVSTNLDRDYSAYITYTTTSPAPPVSSDQDTPAMNYLSKYKLPNKYR